MRKLLFTLPFLLLFCSSGCDLVALRTAATEPHPTTGLNPVQTIIGAAPGVLAAPADLTGWANIISSLVVMGSAGFGYKEWRKFRKGAPSSGSPLVKQ